MGNKPVGLGTLIGLLLGIALLFSAVIGWNLHDGGSDNPTAKFIFFVCLALVPFAIAGHVFGFRLNRDIHPDVLEHIYGGHEVIQMDDCHIMIDAVELPGGIRFVVSIQNRFDHEVELTFKLDPWTTWQFPGRVPPPLTFTVEPSGVYVAHLWRQFESVEKDTWFKCRLKGSTKRKEKGQQVRSARREVLRTEISGVITALGALGGALYMGGHREIKLLWPANNIVSDVPDDETWIIEQLWSPNENQDIEQISNRLRELQGDNPPR